MLYRTYAVGRQRDSVGQRPITCTVSHGMGGKQQALHGQPDYPPTTHAHLCVIVALALAIFHPQFTSLIVSEAGEQTAGRRIPLITMRWCTRVQIQSEGCPNKLRTKMINESIHQPAKGRMSSRATAYATIRALAIRPHGDIGFALATEGMSAGLPIQDSNGLPDRTP